MSKHAAAGPAAYHAQLRAEKITTLEQRIRELEARCAEWVSPFRHSEAIKEATRTAYAAGRKDGYRAGWADKALGVAPHQYPDTEPHGDGVVMTAANR